MELRKRITEIKTLQAQILQSYLKINLEKHYKDEWRNKLRECLTKGAKEYPNGYQSAYREMIKLGIDNYDVSNMDCSIISIILRNWNGPLSKCRYWDIDKDIDNLFQSDRNIDAHANGNESVDDLFLWACGTLFDLKKFIDKALDHFIKSDYTDQEKDEFGQKNAVRIRTLQRLIVDDYQEEIKWEIIMEDDLQRIFDSYHPILEYGNLINKKYRICTPSYYYFLKVCADGGIYQACYELADLYFYGSGYLWPSIDGRKPPEGAPERNFELALKYYKKGKMAESNPHICEPEIAEYKFSLKNRDYCNVMLRYIGLSSKGGPDALPTDQCEKMLEAIREKFELEEYSENGVTYYMCNEKKNKDS